MLIAIAQFTLCQRFDLVGLEQVVLASRRDVYQRHSRFDSVLEIEILVEVGRGPKVDQLHRMAGTTDSVDPAKALDDSHWIPVDVIIDQIVTILQVLAFRNTVSGNQQVNLIVLRHVAHFCPLFRPWGKVGQDGCIVSFAKACAVFAVAGDKRDIDAKSAHSPIIERVV